MALFGHARLFVPEEGVKSALEGDALVLRQKEASLSLNSEGSISFSLPLTEDREGITAIIEENVGETIAKALEFAAAGLDKIDPVERLTHIAIALRLRDGGYRGWRTRQEHAASPNSGTMGIRASNQDEIIHLTPSHMPRTALKHRTCEIAEDLTVLLRRRFRPNR